MRVLWLAGVVALGFAAPAFADDGSCPAAADEPIAAVARSVRGAKKISDKTWRKHVAEFVSTTDGVWGPSKDGMTKVKKGDLNACLKSVYTGYAKSGAFDGTPDVFTAKVDGKSIYLFEVAADGATLYDLRDARCRELKMGDKPHDPQPLPHPAESDATKAEWIAHLKDLMRMPNAMRDAPIVEGDAIPAAVRTEVAARAKKYGTDEYGTFDVKTEVHHIRMDSRDSWLVYFDMEDGVSIQMFDSTGKELDVDPF